MEDSRVAAHPIYEGEASAQATSINAQAYLPSGYGFCRRRPSVHVHLDIAGSIPYELERLAIPSIRASSPSSPYILKSIDHERCRCARYPRAQLARRHLCTRRRVDGRVERERSDVSTRRKALISMQQRQSSTPRILVLTIRYPESTPGGRDTVRIYWFSGFSIHYNLRLHTRLNSPPSMAPTTLPRFTLNTSVLRGSLFKTAFWNSSERRWKYTGLVACPCRQGRRRVSMKSGEEADHVD